MFLYLCIKAKWWPVNCHWFNILPPNLSMKFLSVGDSFHLREIASQVGSLGGSLVKAGEGAAELYSSVGAYMSKAPAAECTPGLHSASQPEQWWCSNPEPPRGRGGFGTAGTLCHRWLSPAAWSCSAS